MKLNYKQTFLIGFGFFASSIAWSMYNVYVPKLLEQYLSSTFFIGIVMTFDNIFGVVFQPLFGTLSDKTRTKYGRRLPYILLGIPVSAALFILIPWTWNLISLMIVVIGFVFVMSIWRAPVVALMPDITPSKFRSQANGIINFMGGLGSLFSYFVGGLLFKLGGVPLPFLTSGLVMLFAGIMLKLFVHEKEPEAIIEDTKNETVETSNPTDHKKMTKSLVFLLVAILFWFSGFNAVETFFSLYVTNTLKDAAGNLLTAGDASLMLSLFSLSFLAFAIPSGIIGAKVGRRITILIGLTGLSVLFAVMMFVKIPSLLQVMLLIGGMFWALVNINSLPMVVQMAKWKDIGKYTGYYYFFSFSAAIVSPILFGWLRDVTKNYQILFVYSAVAYTTSLILMLFVRHGEVTHEDSSPSSILENADL